MVVKAEIEMLIKCNSILQPFGLRSHVKTLTYKCTFHNMHMHKYIYRLKWFCNEAQDNQSAFKASLKLKKFKDKLMSSGSNLY